MSEMYAGKYAGLLLKYAVLSDIIEKSKIVTVSVMRMC